MFMQFDKCLVNHPTLLQSILSLVRKADPPGSRTLGVLTKPDTIEPGTHQGFVDLVTGKRWVFLGESNEDTGVIVTLS
jgi:hypothetical protein